MLRVSYTQSADALKNPLGKLVLLRFEKKYISPGCSFIMFHITRVRDVVYMGRRVECIRGENGKKPFFVDRNKCILIFYKTVAFSFLNLNYLRVGIFGNSYGQNNLRTFYMRYFVFMIDSTFLFSFLFFFFKLNFSPIYSW